MKKLLFCFTSLLFLGCKNVFISNDIEEVKDLEKKSIEQITEESIETMLAMDALFSARSVTEIDDYPAIMNEIVIEDENGNTIYFENLSNNEKVVIYDEWKRNLYDNILKKLSEDDGLAEMYNIENEAINETLNSLEGERCIKKSDIEKFNYFYEKNLQKILKSSKARSSSSKKGEITNDCLVNSSVQKVKSNYQKGNFLVCKDSSSSNSGSYIGHASLMKEDNWNSAWENDGLGEMTITSSPINKSAQWDNKKDGVQYEPIGYWAGNAEGSANKVSIYKVQHVKIQKKGLFETETITSPVSDSERDTTITTAEQYKNCGYSWLYINKWREDKIYCSQLVWKSWYKTSEDCDLSLGKTVVFVSPSDLTKSPSAVFLTSYSNKE